MTPSGDESSAQGMRAAMGLEIQRANLRRQMPDASDAVIETLLSAWLVERPGAVHGDAEGRICHRDFGPR